MSFLDVFRRHFFYDLPTNKFKQTLGVFWVRQKCFKFRTCRADLRYNHQRIKGETTWLYP